MDTTSKERKRRILFVAWWLSHNSRWLGAYLDTRKYECTSLGLPFPPCSKGNRITVTGWLDLFKLALQARWHLLWNDYDLVVVAAPRLAFAFSFIKLLSIERTPLVVWPFNCGYKYRGASLILSQIAFRQVERFVVYAKRERQIYSQLFKLPENRFRFTLLIEDVPKPDQLVEPYKKYGLPPKYIASLGSASRDFQTLFDATEGLDILIVVVTHRFAVEDLEIPHWVKVIESIAIHDYLAIMASAQLVVLPINNPSTASGQFTLVQAMALGVPVVGTRCIGTEDYILEGDTGIFVEKGNHDQLHRVLKSLLEDEEKRESLSSRAQEFARDHFSLSSGARVLDNLFNEIYNAQRT